MLLELGGNNAIPSSGRRPRPGDAGGPVQAVGRRPALHLDPRLIVHRAVDSTTVDRLVKAYQQVRIGDPLAEGTLMGAVTAERSSHDAALDRAKADGGEILTGGRLARTSAAVRQPAIVRMPQQTPLCATRPRPDPVRMATTRSTRPSRCTRRAARAASALFTATCSPPSGSLSAGGSDVDPNVNIGTSGAEIAGVRRRERDGRGREAGSDAWKAYCAARPTPSTGRRICRWRRD